MLIYRYFDGFNYTEGDNFYAKLSFGNMGESTSNCGTNFIDWDGSEPDVTLSLQCPGTARIRRIIDSGVDSFDE